MRKYLLKLPGILALACLFLMGENTFRGLSNGSWVPQAEAKSASRCTGAVSKCKKGCSKKKGSAKSKCFKNCRKSLNKCEAKKASAKKKKSKSKASKKKAQKNDYGAKKRRGKKSKKMHKSKKPSKKSKRSKKQSKKKSSGLLSTLKSAASSAGRGLKSAAVTVKQAAEDNPEITAAITKKAIEAGKKGLAVGSALTDAYTGEKQEEILINNYVKLFKSRRHKITRGQIADPNVIQSQNKIDIHVISRGKFKGLAFTEEFESRTATGMGQIPRLAFVVSKSGNAKYAKLLSDSVARSKYKIKNKLKEYTAQEIDGELYLFWVDKKHVIVKKVEEDSTLEGIYAVDDEYFFQGISEVVNGNMTLKPITRQAVEELEKKAATESDGFGGGSGEALVDEDDDEFINDDEDEDEDEDETSEDETSEDEDDDEEFDFDDIDFDEEEE